MNSMVIQNENSKQKMNSKEMFKILKIYILKQREKKKQDLFTSQELQRVKKEEELKRNKVKMTLEEIKDQIQRLENKLSELKAEKHQLFSQLKKVLNEDDMRRRQREADVNHGLNVQSFSNNVQINNILFNQNPFYSTNNSNLRPVYPKFSQHLVQQNSNPKPVNSVNPIPSLSRGMKRVHDPAGPQPLSPPLAPTSQSNPQFVQNYKTAAVTYTPNIQKTHLDYNSYPQTQYNNPYHIANQMTVPFGRSVGTLNQKNIYQNYN